MRWLKHLSMAHADAALAYVLEEFGAEAYGVWWLILEDIAAPMEAGKMDPASSHSAVKWAQICHCSVRRFRSIANCLANKNLIGLQSDIDRIQIAVPNILKYKDEYAKRSGETPEQDREQIESRKRVDIPASASEDKSPKANPVELWFETEFWPSWVKRERDDKGAALNHAKKVAKTEALRSQILAAANSQKRERMAADPEFRKGASGWLRDGGWKHSAEPAQPSLMMQPQGPAYQPWVDKFAHLEVSK